METVSLIGRLLVSLGAVLGVIWLISRRMRKSGRGKASGLIEVLDRRQLSRNSAVAVVRVGDQALVIGVTDHQVSVLGETDAEVATAQSNVESPRPRVAAARPANRQRVTRRSVAAVPTTKTPKPTAAATAAQTATLPAAPAQRGTLTGSALSPQTWKQTIESLREMTARSS